MDVFDELLSGEQKKNPEERIQAGYKTIFATEIGNIVLQDMLWNLKFLSPCENAADMALSNYAKSLLATIYGNDVSMTLLERIFRNLLRRKDE